MADHLVGAHSSPAAPGIGLDPCEAPQALLTDLLVGQRAHSPKEGLFFCNYSPFDLMVGPFFTDIMNCCKENGG
jgi:hypothetical protein